MSAEIPVVQFVRPHAAKRHLLVKVSDEAGRKWREVIMPLGLRLTAEVIPASMDAGGETELEEQVAVCLENPDLGDYRLAISPNTPDSPIVREVEAMILEFDEADYLAWGKSMVEDEEED